MVNVRVFEKKNSTIMKCRSFFCFFMVHQKINGNKTHLMTGTLRALKNQPKNPKKQNKKLHPNLSQNLCPEPNKYTHEKSGSHEF